MRRLSRDPSGPDDLFDVLAAEEAAAVVHMILPNFLTACGLDYLEVCRHGRIKGTKLYTLTSAQATCPKCLTVGQQHGGLSALCRRISGNQASIQG